MLVLKVEKTDWREKMKVQVVSDLHLEFIENKGRFKLNKSADLLIIAGDLGCGNDRQLALIKEISKEKPVILVLGNHDFMWSSIKETVDFWHNVQLPNFYFLNDKTIEIEGVHFIGSPLWSDLSKDPTNHFYILKNMADYKAIYKNETHTNFINIQDIQIEYENHIDFIKHELGQDYKRKVLITHHLPTSASVSHEYLNSKLNAAFMTDLSNLLLFSPNLELCIHGHTHKTLDYKLGEMRVFCNPLGYPHENNEYSNDILINL